METKLQIISKETLFDGQTPPIRQITDESGNPVKFSDHMHISTGMMGSVAEFIGTGDLPAVWGERQHYEVNVGRDSEPILYTPIYPEVNDPNLPQVVKVNQFGPASIIVEEVEEGGEVKMISLESSDYNVTIKHYGFGLEYTKDFMMYNQMWNVALAERQGGIAVNALLNHLHLYPFINYSYGSANQTPASSIGSTLVEKTMRTLEDAVTNAKTDATNPRRGPYWILCSASNFFTLQRALDPVPQQGFTQQSSALLPFIKGLIVYDGWSGKRGKKTVSYPGVTANKCYLISIGFRDQDFGSFIKQPITPQNGDGDVTRFVIEQTVWDIYLGVYASIIGSAEEVTLPTS